jgi:hypothetical protein
MAYSQLLAARVLDGNPCSVAAAPGFAASGFAVGTYTLDEKSGSREGQLYFFSLSDAGLEERGVLLAAGIFDVRWRGDLVACACSDGSLLLCAPPDGHAARVVCDVVCAKSSMCTSADWAGDGRLVTCDQDGFAHLISLAAEPTVVASWRAHSLEAWVVRSSDEGGAHCIYSGADDSCFKGCVSQGAPVSLSPTATAGTCERCPLPPCST